MLARTIDIDNMSSSFKVWLENNSIGTMIQNLYDQDQAERREYKGYLAKFPDWKKAAAAWSQDKQRNPNDVFDDTTRLQQAKQLISQNIDKIKMNPSWLKMAWLLVQHMDNDLPFQKWFIQHLRKGGQNWQYLTDRILVNQGKSQKYGTQQTA